MQGLWSGFVEVRHEVYNVLEPQRHTAPRRGTATSAKPRGYRNQLARLAASGDVARLVDCLAEEGGFFSTTEEKKRLLREAFRRCERRGLEQLVEKVLGLALANDGEMLARAVVMMRRKIKEDDRDPCSEFRDLSPEVVNTDLARIAILEERLIKLCKAAASIRHVFALGNTPVNVVPKKLPRRVASQRIIPIATAVSAMPDIPG